MIKFAWKMIKLAVVAPLVVVGLGTATYYGSQYYKIPIPFLDGTTVLRVTEVKLSGDQYVAHKFTLTDKNHLYAIEMQGPTIESMTQLGDGIHIVVNKIDRDTLLDIARLVDQPNIEMEEVGWKDDHYVCLSLGSKDNFFTSFPERQKASAVLVRAIERLSQVQQIPTKQP